MEVILLEKVRNLGNLGDKVRVKPGFARNFLLPRQMAVRASAQALAQFEARRSELEAKAVQVMNDAQKRHAVINGQRFVIQVRASEEGRLFGSVTPTDIAKLVSAAGTAVQKQEVKIEAAPIRVVGEYEIELALHPEVSARVTLVVQAV